MGFSYSTLAVYFAYVHSFVVSAKPSLQAEIFTQPPLLQWSMLTNGGWRIELGKRKVRPPVLQTPAHIHGQHITYQVWRSSSCRVFCHRPFCKTHSAPQVFYRHGVAGAVLRPPLSLNNSLSESYFKTLSLPNCKSQGAKILRERSPFTMCHMSLVMCPVSHVICKVSYVSI